jgi:signal transduction histidine kinase
VLRTVSWLIRGVAYVWIGVDVFTNASFGPVALPVTAVGYGLCGVLLAVWALMDTRGAMATSDHRTFALAMVLGVIAAVSGALSAQPGTTSIVALGVIATLDAGTEIRLPAGWGVMAAGILGTEVAVVVTGGDADAAFGLPLLMAVGLLAGLNRRAYRVRAEQSAVLLAQGERLRAQQRQVAVLDERARIAREIHDVLAHSLGALGIQIQAARALLTDHQDTDRAVEVLTVAQRMASDGLTETRRAVHALRTDTPPLAEELTRMAGTHEQRHGSTVALTIRGGTAPLPAEQTLALVRTAQESLTNAAKHAPRRPVTIDLLYGDDEVTLTLTNPLGPATPEQAAEPDFATVDGGYGLTGMRERLLLLGGTLTAGPADGSWTVTARVPVPLGQVRA